MVPEAPVGRIDARSYTIPTDAPEADGTIEWDRTTIVVVEVAPGGMAGLGLAFRRAGAERYAA